MMKLFRKNADNVALTIGFCACIIIGYYIGVERSFSAFSVLMRLDSGF
jgi:hypothetical protein